MTEWVPRSAEDRLLYRYWLERGGQLYLEVSIGTSGATCTWPKGTKVRRLDAVRICDAQASRVHCRERVAPAQYWELFRNQDIEIIEAKVSLSRYVFGQALTGREMFVQQYQPKSVTTTIVCKTGDPGLEWVCRKYGVQVVQVAE